MRGSYWVDDGEVTTPRQAEPRAQKGARCLIAGNLFGPLQICHFSGALTSKFGGHLKGREW